MILRIALVVGFYVVANF